MSYLPARSVVALQVDIPRALVVSSNDRMHWRAEAKLVADLRQIASLRARGMNTVPGPVDVTVTVSWPDRRRRDTPNLWPTVKPLIDGMVDAGVLVDDSDAYVRRTTFQASSERCPRDHVRLLIAIGEVS